MVEKTDAAEPEISWILCHTHVNGVTVIIVWVSDWIRSTWVQLLLLVVVAVAVQL